MRPPIIFMLFLFSPLRVLLFLPHLPFISPPLLFLALRFSLTWQTVLFCGIECRILFFFTVWRHAVHVAVRSLMTGVLFNVNSLFLFFFLFPMRQFLVLLCNITLHFVNVIRTTPRSTGREVRESSRDPGCHIH